MRLPFALLATLVATLSVRADADVPVTVTPIPDQNLSVGAAATTIDLASNFTLPGVTGQIVQFATTEGNIFVELLPTAAPNTVTNFLSYVNDGSYSNSIIHRSETEFLIQGGGFKADSNLSAITAKAAVANEYNLPNERGTLAMAKLGGQPDSATNQWFFNLVDNTTTLGPDNNSGFTVFARVLGTGMTVADKIAALPIYPSLSSINPAFASIPLADVLPNQGPLYLANLVGVLGVATAKSYTAGQAGTAFLAYRIENSNPAVVTVALKGTVLTLTPGKSAGRSVVTVRDFNNNFAATRFVVTLAAPAKATPVSQSVPAGQPATFSILAAADGSTYQWQRKAAGSAVWASLAETAPYSGTTGTTLTVAAATTAMSGDQFQCLVTTGAVTVVRAGATLSVVPAPLAVQTAQKTYVSASVALDVTGGTPGGLTYFASGLPAGLTINPATGQITGKISAKAGTYTATYWSQNGTLKSAAQTVTFVVKAFPLPMVAAYEALLVDEDGVPAGKLELNVTSTGAFTGRLTCTDVLVYSLRGQLALNADYSAGVATLSIPRPAQPASPFSLVLNVFNDSSFASALTRLDPDVTPVAVGSSEYSDSAVVPSAKASGAPWLGNYTLVLGNPQNLDASTLDAATTPAGVGYATIKIPTTGLMTLKGKTADGAVLTASLVTSYSASYRAFIKPYKTGGGYLAGLLQMAQRSDSTSQVPVYHVATTSDFYWGKAANAADKTYPQGFGPVGLEVSVEPWKPTVSLAGTFPLVISEAGVTNSGGNTDQLPTSLTLSSTYVATLAAPSNLANPSGWSVKINTATGAFTGSFNVQRTVNGLPATLKVPVEGVLRQPVTPAATTPIAQGFFLLPPNATSGSTPVSGRVELLIP